MLLFHIYTSVFYNFVRFGSLDERTVAHYTRQIATGIRYLHHNGIIHRDIKGANVMVTSKGLVKLIDFGCAKRHCQVRQLL
jgi:mitogen-activated protein kinase kinase kinase 19